MRGRPAAPIPSASKEAGREADYARTRPVAARSLPRPPGAATAPRRCTAGRVRTARRERPLSGPGPGSGRIGGKTTLSQAVQGHSTGGPIP